MGGTATGMLRSRRHLGSSHLTGHGSGQRLLLDQEDSRGAHSGMVRLPTEVTLATKQLAKFAFA